MTYNRSFIDISNELEKNNITNRHFILNTYNPVLRKMNSFEIYNYFIDCNNKYFPLIIEECENNIWFFFREIVRVGPYGDFFNLNMERLLFIWSYANGISCVNHYKGGVTTVMELLYIYHKIFSKETNLGCSRKFEFTTNNYKLSDDIMKLDKNLFSLYGNRINKQISKNTDLEYSRMTGDQQTFYNIRYSTTPEYDKYVEKFIDTSNDTISTNYYTFGFDVCDFIETIPMMISCKNKNFKMYSNITTSSSELSIDLSYYVKYSIPTITFNILNEKNIKYNIYKIL